MTVEAIAVVAEESLGEGIPRFRDAQSGCVFYVTTPGAHPVLWDRYLRGALDNYRRFGVEAALEYGSIRDGRGTALFFLALDPSGAAVAGVRMQGSYDVIGQVRGVADWVGHPGAAALRRMVAERIPSGVVEAKGAWVSRDSPHRDALGAAISRTVPHALGILGARYGFATVATFTVDRHRAGGAVVAEGIPPAPYPDERYETVPLWWDIATFADVAEPAQCALVAAERRELGWNALVPDTGERLGYAR